MNPPESKNTVSSNSIVDKISPKQASELTHIKGAMAEFSDEELLEMYRRGAKALIALELRKEHPHIDLDLVGFACR